MVCEPTLDFFGLFFEALLVHPVQVLRRLLRFLFILEEQTRADFAVFLHKTQVQSLCFPFVGG